MPVKKVPIDPSRSRPIPQEGFSWIDRRFVSVGFIEDLPGEAILLYFFLASVSDARGLSFYSDPTTSRILKLTPEELSQSRARLTSAGLILYRYPVYQVLSLPPQRPQPTALAKAEPLRGGEPISLADFFERVLKGPPGSKAPTGGRP